MTVSIGPATAADLLDLRRQVLRDGRDDPPSSHVSDDAPDTVHLAARDVLWKGYGLVGVAEWSRGQEVL